MTSKRVIAAIAVAISASACTTVRVVQPDTAKYQIRSACIVRNDKVIVRDFVSVMQAGFLRHGIETELYDSGKLPDSCRTTVRYTALRGWDLAPFMNYAEITMMHDGRVIGTATYEHSGGLALNKWADTATKMDPVIDQMLAGYTHK